MPSADMRTGMAHAYAKHRLFAAVFTLRHFYHLINFDCQIIHKKTVALVHPLKTKTHTGKITCMR